MLSKFCTIEAYTDGASKLKYKIGAWAYSICVDQQEVSYDHMCVENATNNQMEISAMIQCFKALSQSSDEIIHICSDSKYLLNGISSVFTSLNTGETEFHIRWIDKWKKNGWKTLDNKEVSNKELWIELDNLYSALSKNNKVIFFHTKGHGKAGYVEGNERVDLLCNVAMKKYFDEKGWKWNGKKINY